MTKLKRLSIKGIRAFNYTRTNTIEFDGILTLIVGKNGTGKTTIIEALKYLTTGDVPPNSKNAAFICDPRSIGELDVKASVALQFEDKNGILYEVMRVINSTQKANKNEMKTIDVHLARVDDDKKNILSSRGNDVDNLVSLYMETAPSILQNVLFCHQEEATWPVGDPTVLKKKLDEIFASEKYNKALLQLKAAKKEIEEKHKHKKTCLSYVQKNKIKKEDLANKLTELTATIIEKVEKLEKMTEETKLMELSLKDLKEKEHTFMQLEKEYNSIKNELDGAKQCVNEHPEMKDLIDNRNLMNEIEEIIRLINEKQRNLNNSRIKEMEHELVFKEVQFKNISRAKEKYEEDEKRIEGYGETTRNYERKRDEIIQWCNENDIESLPEITLIEISKKLKTKQSEYKTRLEELKRSRGEWQMELNKCRQAEYHVKEAQEYIKKHEDLLSISIDKENILNVENEVYNIEKEIEDVESGLDILDVSYRKILEQRSMSENAGEILRFDKAYNILCKMISRADLNEEVVMEHLNQLEMKIAQLTREMKAKETEMNVAAYENKKIKEKEAELTERMNSLANRFRNIAPAKYQIGWIFADFESIQKRIIQNEAMVEVLEKNMIYSGETKACILCTGKEITDQYFKKLHEIVLRDEEINNHKQETERLRRSIDINLTMERAKLMNELSVEYNKHKENLANIKPNLNLKTLQDQHDMITRKYEEMNHSYAEFKQNHIIYKEFININRNNIDKELENIKTVMNSRKAQLNNLKAELKIRYKQREIKQKQTEIHSKQLEVQKAKRIIDQHDFNQLTKCEMHLIAYENELDEISDGFSRFKAISEVKLQEIDQISRILEDISINATLHKNNPFNWKHYEEVKCAYEKASSNHERELTTKMQITGDLNNLYKSKTEIEQLIKFKNALAIIEKHRHITERYDKVTHNSLKEKLITLTQSQNQLINYQSRIEGEIKQLDLVKTAREIELKEYANVTEEFNKLALEIKIFEFQVEDVQKAVVALEKTIIEYHAAKIEEVNTALCDLWTNTYSNKDISRIELKSDLTATSYSYRMVMYNQSEIPLDMRGRCSAGQKMIASILFRMALAECFSDANLITLDEPTTNLDATNMEKLAETLNNLLLTKSDMQLVVITHDEEFVGMINRVGSKSIYKIEKDSRGMSNIKIDTISY